MLLHKKNKYEIKFYTINIKDKCNIIKTKIRKFLRF
jgi:hypothetical protein